MPAMPDRYEYEIPPEMVKKFEQLDTLICPDCGKGPFKNNVGMSAHRRAEHGFKGLTEAEAKMRSRYNSRKKTEAGIVPPSREASSNGAEQPAPAPRKRSRTEPADLRVARILQELYPKGIPTDDLSKLAIDLSFIGQLYGRVS